MTSNNHPFNIANMNESIMNSTIGDHESNINPIDAPYQVTLSFHDRALVFDEVPREKVQFAILLLGGFEFRRNTKRYMSNDPKRQEYLNKYYQKRKNRCFENKIRYNIRQKVALTMNRKQGKFAPKNVEQVEVEEAKYFETACTHCGISSNETPMMRKGPTGQKTLCNACGLYWINKGTLRDINKRRT